MKLIPWIVIPKVLQSARNCMICSCFASPVALAFSHIICLILSRRSKFFNLKNENLEIWHSWPSWESFESSFGFESSFLNSFWKTVENASLDSSVFSLQMKFSISVSIGVQCISELEGLEKLSNLSFNCFF